MKRLLSSNPFSPDFAAFLMRLIVGGLFCAYHGYDKVVHYHLYLSMTKDIIGIGPQLTYNLIIFAELFCGFLVLIGLLTRVAIIPLFINMSVAFLVVHAHDPFLVKELAFLFWVLCLPVFVLGSGKYSADRLLLKK